MTEPSDNGTGQAEMGDADHRHIGRDSLFVMADLRLDGSDGIQRVKIRNLSSGGLMAEGAAKIGRGQQVSIELRNIGWVDGSIAWVQGSRCGIAFNEEIDPKLARVGQAAAVDSAAVMRRPVGSLHSALDADRLRKI
jgi:PilZ domain